MKRRIQIFEHRELSAFSLCTDCKPLGEEAIDALWKYNDENEQKYFIGTRYGVKFKHYVGVIQVGDITIEILPKADANKEGNHNQWQGILVQMLKYCKWIQVDSLTSASLAIRNHSLLDLYFELYLSELEKLMHLGLVKKYKQVKGNQKALKGSLKFADHIQQNLIYKTRFFTSYQVYSQDHLLHQILLCALKILKRINRNHLLVDRINRVLFLLPEISQKKITAAHFKQIVLNRKTVPYAEVLKIAKMLILNFAPDIKGGKENMIAILFDMNRLWEEFVYHVLANNLGDGYTVSFQNQQKFWDTKTIRPDIFISHLGNEGTSNYVIDTKWKIIADHNPSDEDLKQIFAYNAHWNCENSLLLYPSSAEKSRFTKGNYHFRFKGIVHHCSLGLINVINSDGKLNTKFHENIIEMLIPISETKNKI